MQKLQKEITKFREGRHDNISYATKENYKEGRGL